MNNKTKLETRTATKLRRVAELSGKNPKMEFRCLMPHFNKESLIGCFNELNGKKAVGIDRQTKEEYGRNLEENIVNLIGRMKTMSYRPAPVREVLIPKDNGKIRPLGISNFEDKIIQLMFSKILEVVYEPIFYDFSYGFRRGRSCHQAIKACQNYLFSNRPAMVIDVDLENFFGSIDHRKLLALLRMKIKDKVFVRYIARMLKSGILSNGELRKTDEGTPQGSVVSPILANIFAHYALDKWFVEMVATNCEGKVVIFRYADDLVTVCGTETDAQRILQSLKARMHRFSLKLNQEKTKLVPFDKNKLVNGEKQGTFDFLGFTFYLGNSKNGKAILPKLKTSSKRFRSKLKVVSVWCRANRHKMKMRDLWNAFSVKLAGHIRYYGVSHNSRYVLRFMAESKRIFFKWINRRGQRKSMNWKGFGKFLEEFPPPKVKVYHNMFAI